MRVIKFRVYSTVTGSFDFVSIEELMTSDNSNISLKGFNEDLTVMQFTGLTDKHGVDIYEGDVLINDLGRVCRIRWHDHQARFDAEFIEDTNYQRDIDMTQGFRNCHMHISTKVIGNIHQNPELLEKQIKGSE
tara:strand:- start:170 stop:568 length:399 start_codon:yes stop_codon:yes gene_type:complete